MRKLTVSLTVFVLGLIALPVSASAAPPAPRTHVANRQAHQEARIAQGLASGQLTVAEAGRLQAQQRRIQITKRAMIANDGHLGPVERARLDAMQDRANRNIAVQKHDAQTR